jgi:hypothetical protein
MIFSVSKKTKLTAILSIALLMASILMLTVIPLSAQLAEDQPYSGTLKAGDVPDFTVETTAFISVRPSLTGFEQLILVNTWIIPAPNAHREFLDMKMTVTPPTGSAIEFEMDSYVADGTAWFEWEANEIGEWSFQFEFPGMYFPAGRYLDGDIINATSGGSVYPESVYYEPSSSPEMTCTVQEDIVYSWPDLGLPTDYWTRPVPYEHREWWPIAGNFPWHGPGGGSLWDELYPDTNPTWGGHTSAAGTPPGFFGAHEGTFTPWVEAPDSPHVVWKNQYSLGGIIGGDFGVEIYDVNIFSGSSAGRFPQIILDGRAYQAYTKPGVGTSEETYWQCYDIRTGEVFWEYKAAVTTTVFMGFFVITTPLVPVAIEYFDTGLLPGGGVSGAHEHVTDINLLRIDGGRLYKWDPWTGALSVNVSVMDGTYYRNGYALSVQNIGNTTNPNYRLINWTTQGTSASFASRVMNNITWPWSSLPATTDFNVGISALVSKSYVAGAPYKTSIRAASLTTGAELWNVSIDEWEYSGSGDYADHGKIAVLTEQGYFVAYNLNNGHFAWKSDVMDYPWDAAGFGAYNVLSAYGLLYRNGYSAIYAFNWDDGSLAWKYTSPAAATYETPYINEDGLTVYSTNIGGAIADGKYYIYNTEHSASIPITRGWQLHCINATTGEGIWKVGIAGASSKHTSDIGPIADGYLTLAGSDGYTYVFGKGKSETTVSAPQTAVPKGTKMTITGKVLDMSPAQEGTPCVSLESMALQMEYIHKQLPIDGIWHNETITGVPVTLTAIHEDGSSVNIGTATTEGYYGTFGKSWTPDKEGTYEIIASFAGDKSYGSSGDSTFVTVGPAPSAAEPETEPPTTAPPTTAPPTTAPPTTAPPTTAPPTSEAPTTAPPTSEEPSGEAPFPTTEVVILAAVVVAVIIGIGAYWALRRQK